MESSRIVAHPLHNQHRESELSIIVVPDFSKEGNQAEQSWSWVGSIMPQDGASAQILRFDYRVAVDGPSIWRQLSEKGDDLIKIFRRDPVMHQIFKKPWIVVGHGFGGLVVKRALSVLSDPGMPLQSRVSIDLIAGILFFGTPHTKNNRPQGWSRLTQLLQCTGKWPKRFLVQSETDAIAAASICEDFEQSGIEAPVLSIYELKPTRLKQIFWPFKREAFLVDKVLSETWAKNEKLLGNETGHDGVSTFQSGSPIHQEIGLLILSALSMSKSVMTKSAINAKPSNDQIDLWESTVSHLSASHDLGSGISPPDAIFGSSMPSNLDHIPSHDLSIYVEEDPSTKWPCYVVDPFAPEPEFTGRNDVFDTIDACFFPQPDPLSGQVNAQDLPCCCISGLGGMGKTQTAIEYALARRDRFDAIFVVQADVAAKLSESFAKIAPALGLMESTENNISPGEETNLIVSRSKAMKWLSAPKFAPAALQHRANTLGHKTPREICWLLIFDNVEDASLLRDYWPVGSDGCILVTTRDARTGNYLRSHTAISLEHLATPFAANLLLRLSFMDGSNANFKDASAIVEKLGCLPIAIRQVAAYIFRKYMTLEEFQTLYDKSLLERVTPDTSSGSWSHTIATSWALDDLGGAAKTLIQTFASLDPDRIQDSIFARPAVQNLLKDYPIDELEYIDARGELTKGSLIRLNTNTMMISMHRLVQDIVLARMNESQRVETFDFATDVLNVAWPTTTNRFEHEASHWTAQESLLPHISRLAEISGKYNISHLDMFSKRRFVNLLQRGGWYLQERGSFVDGNPLYERGLQICSTSPEAMLDLQADITFSLLNAASETNDFPTCLKYVREHLDLRLRVDEGKSPLGSDCGIAFSSFGLGLLLTGDYEGAVKQCDISIAIYAEQPDVLDGTFCPTFPHIHRALALTGARRAQDAEAGLLRIVQWREAHFGPDDTESFKLGYVQHCLGLVYAHSGRPINSIAAYRKAYANYKATVGTRYHRYAAVCGKIAEYHVSLNQFEAAE